MPVRTSLLEQGSNLTAHAEHHSCVVRPNASSMHARRPPRRPALDAARRSRCRRCKAKASPARHESARGRMTRIPQDVLKARRGPCAGTAVAGRRRLAVLGSASFARRLELDMRASRTHRTPERRRRSWPIAYGQHLEMPPPTFHDRAMSRGRRVFVGARLRSTD